MIDRNFLARRAAGLLKLAKATADHDLAATLVAKTADLKARIDESGYPEVTLVRQMSSNPAYPDKGAAENKWITAIWLVGNERLPLAQTELSNVIMPSKISWAVP